MAITQTSVLPQQYISQLGQNYGQQLAGLTAIPLDTSQFAPTVAAQDPLQTQAATLAGTGVGAYAPYLTEAAALKKLQEELNIRKLLNKKKDGKS